MNNRRVFLQTYGCQMNERDSEEILGMLGAVGYERVERAEEADVILLNTCSVRAHAEDRAFGKMGLLKELKRERPDRIFGILGCMAKAQREEIFRKLPHVDLVAGPAELYDLPMLLAEVESRRRQHGAGGEGRGAGEGAWGRGHGAGDNGAGVLAVDRPFRPLDRKPTGDYRAPGASAFVTIMEGCDKRCAYCIVPFTRGLEVSRPMSDVVAEVRGLAEAGYVEVTLLGQNVNSYGKRFPDGTGYKGRSWDETLREERGADWVAFPELLRAVDARTGVRRVRFTTSHPFDAHEHLFRAMAECGTVCEHLHLPVQSGSDAVLRRMLRGYTVDAYRRKVDALRRMVPGVALTTDFIVGFPGETDEDCEATVRLAEEIGYDGAFIFKYSPRPGTAAAALSDGVPLAVKEARHQRLLTVQEGVSLRRNQAQVGRTVEVLVEGTAGRGEEGALRGRTRTNKIVVFRGPAEWVGRFCAVRVTGATAHTLFGELTS